MADANFQVKKGLTVPKGSQSEPSIIFTAADNDTGIYSPAEDQVSVATAGSEVVRVNSSGQIQAVSSGSAAVPIYTFAEDNDTGIFSPGDNEFSVTTSGVERVKVNASGDIDVDNGGFVYNSSNKEIKVSNTGNVKIYADSSGGYIEQDVNNLDFLHLISSGKIKYQSDPQNDTAQTGHIFENDGSEVARIDDIGALLIGTENRIGVGDTSIASLQVVASGNSSKVNIANFGSDSNDAATINLGASRSGAVGSYSIVGNGDTCGILVFSGDDGIDLRSQLATISAEVDSTPGPNSMPGRLVLSTTPSGSASPTERMRITSDGKLLVGTSAGVTSATAIECEGSAAINRGSNVATTAPEIIFGRRRGAGATVNGNDLLTSLNIQGWDGSNYIQSASINAYVDGTPGANDMPGRLVFSVTADGSASPTEAMRIKNSGIINIANTPVYADNAAAKTGGLVDGDVYRTSTGDLKIVYT